MSGLSEVLNNGRRKFWTLKWKYKVLRIESEVSCVWTKIIRPMEVNGSTKNKTTHFEVSNRTLASSNRTFGGWYFSVTGKFLDGGIWGIGFFGIWRGWSTGCFGNLTGIGRCKSGNDSGRFRTPDFGRWTANRLWFSGMEIILPFSSLTSIFTVNLKV